MVDGLYQEVRKAERSLIEQGLSDSRRTHVLRLHPAMVKMLRDAYLPHMFDLAPKEKGKPPKFQGYEIVEYPYQRRTMCRVIPRKWWEAIQAEHTEPWFGGFLPYLPRGFSMARHADACTKCGGVGLIVHGPEATTCETCQGSGVYVDWETVMGREWGFYFG